MNLRASVCSGREAETVAGGVDTHDAGRLDHLRRRGVPGGHGCIRVHRGEARVQDRVRVRVTVRAIENDVQNA